MAKVVISATVVSPANAPSSSIMPIAPANLQIQRICEVDEMWSFIGNKKRQRWLWYAWEPRLKRIIAHPTETPQP